MSDWKDAFGKLKDDVVGAAKNAGQTVEDTLKGAENKMENMADSAADKAKDVKDSWIP